MKYRAEIDGLRALAVLPVILFHAGFEWFSGGFVGVDIFFVISGYLITTIIISEIAEGKFSLINFYERRARRILPALVFTVLLTILIAPFILLPGQIKDLGQTLVSISTFLSNYFFYLELDYFNEFSSKNPLLHTWSLAVEEQFYIFFPILLVLIFPKGQKAIFTSLIAIFMLSIFSAQSLSSYDASLSFYSLHTRAWELMFGALVAYAFFYNHQTIHQIRSKHRKIVSFGNIISAIVLGSSFIFFDKNTLHPSFWTLIPVSATAFLILFLSNNDRIARILSSKILVSIGLISYSLYLLHNPIFSYIEIAFENLSDDIIIRYKILALPAILFLSIFSYFFIEKPFRKKELNRSFIFTYSSLALLLMLAFGYITHMKNGFINEMKAFEDSRGIKSFVDTEEELDRISQVSSRYKGSSNSFKCSNELLCRKIVVIGDSFASDVFLSLSYSNEESHVSLVRFDDECFSFISKFSSSEKIKCKDEMLTRSEFNNRFLDATDIIISAKWQASTYADAISLANYLNGISTAKIHISGSIMFANLQTLHRKVPNINDRKNTAQIMYKYIRHDRLNISRKLENLVSQNTDYNWIKRADFFCDFALKECNLFNQSGQPLIWDNAHLTVSAYKPFSQYLLDRL